MITKLEHFPGKSTLLPENRYRKTPRPSENIIKQNITACHCCQEEGLIKIRVKSGKELLECGSCGYVHADNVVSMNINTDKLTKTYPPDNSFIKRALAWLTNKKQHILVYSYNEESIAETLRQAGHDVVTLNKDRNRQDPISGYNFPFRAFDMICCYHSLDFSPEPMGTIKSLLQHLKSDGLLVIHTNFEAIDQLMIDPSIDAKRCSYFRYSTFEKMFEKLNHNIIYRSRYAIIVRKSI